LAEIVLLAKSGELGGLRRLGEFAGHGDHHPGD
jgi:hypothetical protein